MSLVISDITIDGTKREYCVINLNNLVVNDKVLLCFPGGGQTIEDFCQYTQFSSISNTVIVFLGQTSNNGVTFQNAFPWLYDDKNNDKKNNDKTNNNDVLFVDSVLNSLFSNKMPNLFLTGKSDGAGFAMLYSNLSKYNTYIKGICVCSGAYFGLNSQYNIGIYNSENSYINSNNGMIVPYNIVIPKKNIPVFIFHGTNDQIAYYNGANYVNQKAYDSKDSLWKTIDTTVNPGSRPITTNTYTTNIPNFVTSIITNNNLTQYYSGSNSDYSWSSYKNGETECVLNFITINGQGHCWSGHIEQTIPASYYPSNFYLDSTYLFIKFAILDQGNYVQTVSTVPNNLLTYEDTIIVPDNMQPCTKMTATVVQTNADGTSSATVSSTGCGTTKIDSNNAACTALMSSVTNVMTQLMTSTTSGFNVDIQMENPTS